MDIKLGEQQPLLLAVAGPNGAGKSTFQEQFIRSLGLPFVNADEIAREVGLTAYAAAERRRTGARGTAGAWRELCL